MDRQARTGDTVLVMRRKMTDRDQHRRGGWGVGVGGRGKDDRKQNSLALLHKVMVALAMMFLFCIPK
jgi:hypothetical protein